MNVLILHGIMGYAGENWTQWLHDELVDRNYAVQMPTLPKADHPDRQEWLETVRSLADEKNDLIIVGHSLGVTSALDYLEQADHKIKALISVSGIAQAYGLELNDYFLAEKSIDIEKVRSNLEQAFVFYGDNDPYVTQEALASLAKDLQVTPVIISNGGHLNASAGFIQFTQILESILQVSSKI